MKGGVGTWKVIPRGECAQREENMAATSARVEMGEAAVFTWNSFWGQPGWSVWKCGRLLLSSGNTVGRKIDTEHRVEIVTKLRGVCVFEVKLKDEKWHWFRIFMLLLDDLGCDKLAVCSHLI